MLTRRLLWAAIALLLLVVLAGAERTGLVGAARSDAADSSRCGRARLADTADRCGRGRVLTSDASKIAFAFPAPSPDGRRLAYVTGDDNGQAIIHLDLASGERRELYRSSQDAPFDLAWSPDGKYLVFLVSSAQSLSTHLVPTDGSRPAQSIAVGLPLLFRVEP